MKFRAALFVAVLAGAWLWAQEALPRPADAGHAFTDAWNSWAPYHNPNTWSREDAEKWQDVRRKFRKLEEVMDRAGYR